MALLLDWALLLLCFYTGGFSCRNWENCERYAVDYCFDIRGEGDEGYDERHDLTATLA